MAVIALTCFNAASEEQKKPSLAFLEFLAELENVDGQLLSPMDLVENPSTQIPTEKDKQMKNSSEEKVKSSEDSQKKVKAAKKEVK